MTSAVLLERQGPVAVVTLNRPEALNSFDDPMRAELLAALREIAARPEDRAVVLTGAGRCFSSGADLRAVSALSGALVRRQLAEEYEPALEAIVSMAKPVIAALNGPAVGIGLAFALSCDLLVIEQGASLQAPFARLGLLPDGGLTWLLPRTIGYALSYELAAEGEPLSAERALELGLVNRVVPPGGAVAAALEWAQSLSHRSPLALAAAKRALRANLTQDHAGALRFEREAQARLADSEDAAEGVRAFLEKRAPRFRGR